MVFTVSWENGDKRTKNVRIWANTQCRTARLAEDLFEWSLCLPLRNRPGTGGNSDKQRGGLRRGYASWGCFDAAEGASAGQKISCDVGDYAEAMGAKYQRSEIGGRRSGKDTPVEHPVREPGSTGQGGQGSEKDRVQMSDVTGQKWGLREMPTSDLRPPASGTTRE